MLLLTILLGGALLAASGCKDKDDPDPPLLPQYVLPFPDTPDQLMANFVTAYGGMDLEVYRDEVLADVYTFVLQQDTVEEFALADSLFDRDDELAIAQHMFTGQPNLDDRVLSAIQMLELQPLSPWEPVPADDSHFSSLSNTWRRRFGLNYIFSTQSDFRYTVVGAQVFYVECDTVVHGGTLTPRYRLRGQLDQTVIRHEKPSGVATWGELKALWH